jgi:lactobin A/cerein 7B family class IIb bacteriocin
MNLENLNLVELNAQEVKEIEGGFWQVVAGIIAAGIIDDWAGFKRSFAAGFANSI